MRGAPLGPVGEDITWPDQVAPEVKERLVPETSNLQPQTRQGGGLGPGDFSPGAGRLGGRGGGRLWLHSRGISPVYLVPLWAVFPRVTRQMAWALFSAKVSPSGLSGALPWSSSRWRCQVTLICTRPFGRVALEAVLDRVLAPDRVGRVVGLSCSFGIVEILRAGAVPLAGGGMTRMPGPGGREAPAGGRRVQGRGQGGCGGVKGCCRAVHSGLLGARGGSATFSSCSLMQDLRWWDRWGPG